MLVNLNELQTVLIEVESIVNSRPLSCIEDDIKSPLSLTPNNFLTDSEFFDFPTVTNYNWKEIKNNVELFNLWKSRQRLRTIFWDRWRTEYLHQLRSSVKSETNTFKIKIGDVILIGDKTPRLTWKLGKVEEVFVGRDNRISACKLRLASGQSIQRAIQLVMHKTRFLDFWLWSCLGLDIFDLVLILILSIRVLSWSWSCQEILKS